MIKLGYWDEENTPGNSVGELSERDYYKVLDYLQNGKVYRRWRGFSTCRVCKKRNGSVCLTDGTYQWPEGYAHYVLEHNVVPSDDFLAHIGIKRVPPKRAPLRAKSIYAAAMETKLGADKARKWLSCQLVVVEPNGICWDNECKHWKDCANHVTAGQYRSEGGRTPNLRENNGKVTCDKTFIGDYGQLYLRRNRWVVDFEPYDDRYEDLTDGVRMK